MRTHSGGAGFFRRGEMGGSLLGGAAAAVVLLLRSLPAGAADAPVVRTRLGLDGQRVVYIYTLFNPAETPLLLEDFLLVTDEISYPYKAGEPAAPPDIPCHFLPRPFLDSEEGRRAVIYGLSRRPLPSGGEISGLSYATKALPAVGYVVLHRPAETEREALLEKALQHGKVPTDEPFRRLRQGTEIRIPTLVPREADGKGWALWDRFEKDLWKLREVGWISDVEPLNRLVAALNKAREAAEKGRTDAMIEHLQAMARILSEQPGEGSSPEARDFIVVMAAALSTTRPQIESLHLRLTAENMDLQEGEVAGFEARLERWVDGKVCKDVEFTWELRDNADNFLLERKKTRTGPDGRSKAQFQIGRVSSVGLYVTAQLSSAASEKAPAPSPQTTGGFAYLRLPVLPGPTSVRMVPELEVAQMPRKPAGDGEFLWPFGEAFEEARRMVGAMVLTCERNLDDKLEREAGCTPLPLCVEKTDQPPYFLEEATSKPFFRFSEKEYLEERYPVLRKEGSCVEVLLDAESQRTAWIQLSLAPPEGVKGLQASVDLSWERNPDLIHSYEPFKDKSVYPIDPFFLTGRMWRRIYAQPDLSAPWMVIYPYWPPMGGSDVVYLLGREKDFLLIGILGKDDEYAPLGWIPVRDEDGRLTVWDAPFWC